MERERPTPRRVDTVTPGTTSSPRTRAALRRAYGRKVPSGSWMDRALRAQLPPRVTQ